MEGEQSPPPKATPFTIEVAYTGLDLPSSLEFNPDGQLVILERGFANKDVRHDAAVSVLDLNTGRVQALQGRIAAASHFDDMSGNQGGAVGMALDPQFATNGRLFVCYHLRARNGRLENRLSSFQVRQTRLDNETIIVDHLPGDEVHNGCRVVIDEKGLLYLTTGSMEPFDDALDLKRLSGKILRVTTTGAVPADNPFPNSPVWSYGHRNPQGLAFDRVSGALWSTEHGEESSDELNLVQPGANYGFPACRGSAALGETFKAEPYWADRLEIKEGRATCRLAEPHASSYRPAFRTYYPDSTVGISDLVVYRGNAFSNWRGNLLIVALNGRRLFRVEVTNGKFEHEEILIDKQFGRLRDVTVGPDGFVYVLTNESGEQDRWKGRSRILRIRPAA